MRKGAYKAGRTKQATVSFNSVKEARCYINDVLRDRPNDVYYIWRSATLYGTYVYDLRLNKVVGVRA